MLPLRFMVVLFEVPEGASMPPMKDDIQIMSVVRTNNERSWFFNQIGVVYARNRFGVKVIYDSPFITNLITFFPWSEVELHTETLENTCSAN
jgi:hypothetical protein